MRTPTKPTSYLHKIGVFIFLFFFVLVLIAFWPSYFGRLSDQFPTIIHIHGITMTLWCLLLIVQALLIRLGKNNIHKLLGKISYLVAIAVVVTGFSTAHATLEVQNIRTDSFYVFTALMFNSLIVFSIIYLLAIKNKRKPKLHARYMVSTIFPILTPLTDRLTYNHFDFILSYLPVIEGIPLTWLVGFLISDVFLIVLSLWDSLQGKKIKVFPTVLFIMIIYQLTVLFAYRFSLWQVISDFLMNLPLS